MPQFVQTLINLIMSLVIGFSQGGKPATLLPLTQEEASAIGSQVSEEVKSFDHQNSENQNLGVSGETPEEPKNDGRSFGQNVSSQAQDQNDEQNQSENSQDPDTTKVAAHNTKSDKDMPTLIPQVAIDKSEALEPLEDGNTNTEVEDQEVAPEASSNANENASFGQQIAVSQPSLAQADGKNFGQSTSESAKDNSRKPQ